MEITKTYLDAFGSAVIDGTVALALASVTGPAAFFLAPIVSSLLDATLSVILDAIFQSEPPYTITIADVDDEIERLLEYAKGELWAAEIKTYWMALQKSILQRYDSLKNLNQDKHRPNQIINKDEWRMGRPEDWESVVNAAEGLLAHLFYKHYNYEIDVSALLPEFLFQYTRIIHGKMAAKLEHGYSNCAYELNSLRSCYQKTALFITDMLDQAWNKSVDYNDFLRCQGGWHYTSIFFTTKTYHTVGESYFNYPKTCRKIDKSDIYRFRYGITRLNEDWTSHGPAVFWSETQLRYFTVLTTRLYELCSCLDVYSKAFNKSLQNHNPSNHLPTNNVERFYKKMFCEPLDKARDYAYHDLNYKYYQDHAPMSDGHDYILMDRKLETDVTLAGKTFSLGDYSITDITLQQTQLNKDGTKYYCSIPPAFHVMCYSEHNFKGNKTLLTYKTDPRNRPKYKIKSLKIKLCFNDPNTGYFKNVLDGDKIGNNYSRQPGSVNIDGKIIFSDRKSIKTIQPPKFYSKP